MKNRAARAQRRRGRRAARAAGRGLGRGRRASPRGMDVALAHRRDARHLRATAATGSREFRDAIALHDGQTGALVAIGGRARRCSTTSAAPTSSPRCTRRSSRATRSTRSRPATPTRRHRRPTTATAFLATSLDAPASASTTGSASAATSASRTPRVAGAGLVAGDELVQLTAFAEEDGGAAVPPVRWRGCGGRRGGADPAAAATLRFAPDWARVAMWRRPTLISRFARRP